MKSLIAASITSISSFTSSCSKPKLIFFFSRKRETAARIHKRSKTISRANAQLKIILLWKKNQKSFVWWYCQRCFKEHFTCLVEFMSRCYCRSRICPPIVWNAIMLRDRSRPSCPVYLVRNFLRRYCCGVLYWSEVTHWHSRFFVKLRSFSAIQDVVRF